MGIFHEGTKIRRYEDTKLRRYDVTKVRFCPWQDAIGGFRHYCGKGTARIETEERDCLDVTKINRDAKKLPSPNLVLIQELI
jgi:hypothetical protein